MHHHMYLYIYTPVSDVDPRLFFKYIYFSPTASIPIYYEYMLFKDKSFQDEQRSVQKFLIILD